jgi:hypothetical protein
MFPAQSMLLIQRVSPKNSKATLIDWVFNRDGMYSDPRSRAAAMILAKTPDSAFVYRILDGLQLHITLFVIPPNMGYGKGGSTFGCGLGLPPPPSFGWPKVYDYALQDRYGGTGREDWNRTPVAELAEHWVSAERFEENRGPSWCSLGYSEGSSGDGE